VYLGGEVMGNQYLGKQSFMWVLKRAIILHAHQGSSFLHGESEKFWLTHSGVGPPPFEDGGMSP
jgi:hypothetical protein